MEEKNEIIVYQPEGGEFHIEVRLENEWLTQAQMAELFGTEPQNITLHIKNIYSEGELYQDRTCKFFLQEPFFANGQTKFSRNIFRAEQV